jgi:hypothetical protein
LSPSEFEFLINLIEEKISKINTAFRKTISVQERLTLTLCFDKFYDTFLSPLHFAITKTLKKRHNTTDSTTLQDRSIRDEKKNKEADGDDLSRCTYRPAQAVTVSSL